MAQSPITFRNSAAGSISYTVPRDIVVTGIAATTAIGLAKVSGLTWTSFGTPPSATPLAGALVHGGAFTQLNLDYELYSGETLNIVFSAAGSATLFFSDLPTRTQ